jgi:enoyl-CoA hydratase
MTTFAAVSSMAEPLATNVYGNVFVITLNRPAVRNAIDLETAEAMAAAIDELDLREDLSVGIVTGAGGTFCAGMDLKAFLAGKRPSIPGRGFAGLVERPPAKPLIAAVEGYAIAGGFEIALACDLVVSSETARFGLPEVTRGLVAAGGGLLRLPARVPYFIAMEWALTGALIPAADAHAAGLINRLAPAGEALSAAMELAQQISANGPLAVRASKRILIDGPSWPPIDAFNRQREITEPVRASKDAQEGARAFVEKRKPDWSGI